MKKNVIIYVRVSTDEQAEKGYSRPAQLEKINKFCSSKEWNALAIFEEDYTAWKGFDRPAYNELKEFIRQNKGKVDYLLFTQWSRFSRDSAEAHSEIKRLRGLGIEANAIEQWIDFKIPENLYMLSFYLAAPQVENDRLSLRVKDALRKALRDGKWMGKAPYGYYNDKQAGIIVPDPNTSSIVKFAFETFATGSYSIVEVRRMAEEKGIAIKKQQFINMLSNPLYVGKIFIKANEDEPETYVPAIHQALIDPETFEAVQLILKGRSKPYRGKTKGSELPLKGFLICPKCNKIMTGSASKGNGGHYHYYHCQRKYGCNNSYPADNANYQFETYLALFKPKDTVLSLFYNILEDLFKTNDIQRLTERQKLEDEIRRISAAIASLDDKMTNGDLPTDRYNRLIEPLEQRRTDLQIRIISLSRSNPEMKRYLDFSISLLGDVQGYYKKASPSTKQKIIGSIFPENFIFDGKDYRTTRINEVLGLICKLDKGFTKRKPSISAGLSTLAPPVGLEPTTL